MATNTVSYTHVEVPLSLATDCLLMTLSILFVTGGISELDPLPGFSVN